jgi:serine/threonine protein kinase
MEKYQIGKKIGEGSQSIVFECFEVTSNVKYAAKRMNSKNQKELNNALSEVFFFI